MKKNLIQYLTLLLCFVLLALCITQTVQLETYRYQVIREMEELESKLSSAIENIRYDLRNELEEAARPVEDYNVSLSDIDFENRTISLAVDVNLKHWSTDTTVALVISGEMDKNIVEMITDGTGSYFAPLDVSLEEMEGFWLEALVTTGGVSTKMELTGYPDVASLLPLYSSGSGWIGPYYDHGVLTLDFDIFLDWQYQQPGTISNPLFDIYVNGELVQTCPAQKSDSGSYGIQLLQIECGENDNVRMVFRCEDSFGIRYRFTCMEFTLEDGEIFDTLMSDELEFDWITEAENCDH